MAPVSFLGVFVCAFFTLFELEDAFTVPGRDGGHSAGFGVAPVEFVPQAPGLAPPLLLLPVFRYAPGRFPVPFPEMQLLRPVPGHSPVPSSLTGALLPTGPPQLHAPVPGPPVRNGRGVELWCGYRSVHVRLDTSRVGIRASAAHFYLGTCPASRSDGEFVYFNYDLNQCGSSLKMLNSHLIYSNHIVYEPEAQGDVIRAVPLALPVSCLFNRFHYAYKIGYLPEVLEQTQRMNLGTKRVFSLSVRNENWDKLPANASFALGERMYLEAATTFISKYERVFVDSCHVTGDKAPHSTLRHDVISNFGCMVDSKRAGSLSRFTSRQSNTLRFSLDTFLFPNVTSKDLYLHCTVSVGKVTAQATAKSCTYSTAISRWEELDGDASVCRCCNSKCAATDIASHSHVAHAVVTSEPLRLSQKEVDPLKIHAWPNTVLGKVQEEFNTVQDSEEEEEVLRGELKYEAQERLDIKMMGKGHAVEQRPVLEMDAPVVEEVKEPGWNSNLPAVEKTEALISSSPKLVQIENPTDIPENVFGFLDRTWNDKTSNGSYVSIAENIVSDLDPKEPKFMEKTFQDEPDQ